LGQANGGKGMSRGDWGARTYRRRRSSAHGRLSGAGPACCQRAVAGPSAENRQKDGRQKYAGARRARACAEWRPRRG
jgi:hypothetical protein